MILFFDEIKDSHNCGGKALSLSILERNKLPVPAGFVILPSAFGKSGLKTEFEKEILEYAEKTVKGKDSLFAVRSSAASEDSPDHSFAGEFDSLLNIKPDDLISAVNSVYASRLNERAANYSRSRKIESDMEMAVIVQKMILADYAGVLFSADPVSGNYENMTGNFVEGLGEALVSGEKNPEVFTLKRFCGTYNGPKKLHSSAKKMYKAMHRIEKIYEHWGEEGSKEGNPFTERYVEFKNSLP